MTADEQAALAAEAAALERQKQQDDADKAEGAALLGSTEPVSMERVSAFLAKMTVKTWHRFVPDVFSDAERDELAGLLAPVLTQYNEEIFGFFERHFPAIMLGVFLLDKGGDSIDLVRARRRQADLDKARRATPTNAEKAAATDVQSEG